MCYVSAGIPRNFIALGGSMSSLPFRRMAPIVVLALGAVILTPTPLLAEAALPWVFVTGPMMVVGIVPIILIEGFVLQRWLGFGWPKV